MKGIDSSILVYALDPTTEEHEKSRNAILLLKDWVLNPTVVHETYHTLVFKRAIGPNDAITKVKAIVRDRRTHFFNLTKKTSLYSLDLGSELKMGGRDSLIVGCYMLNGAEEMLTHDSALLAIRKVGFKGRQISFRDPLA